MTEQTTSVEDRLVTSFESVFPDLDSDQIRSASKSSVEEWDSLASISLISVIEEEFDIVFDDDVPENVSTFDAAVHAVREALTG